MSKTNRKNIEINAAGQAVGRLATKIAMILIGKHKVGYRPHIDSGDKVVVLNADQVFLSGKKMDKKVYRWHTMHPGGLKEKPAKQVFKEDPKELLRHAVARMIPKNKLRTPRLLRLKFK